MQESINNPVVLLSPKSYAERISKREKISEMGMKGLMRSMVDAAKNVIPDEVVVRAVDRLN